MWVEYKMKGFLYILLKIKEKSENRRLVSILFKKENKFKKA